MDEAKNFDKGKKNMQVQHPIKIVRKNISTRIK